MQILYYVWMNCKSYMAPVSGINDQWIWFGYHWIIFLSQAKKSVEEMVCVERCGSGVALTEFFESQMSVMVIIWASITSIWLLCRVEVWSLTLRVRRHHVLTIVQRLYILHFWAFLAMILFKWGALHGNALLGSVDWALLSCHQLGRLWSLIVRSSRIKGLRRSVKLIVDVW